MERRLHGIECAINAIPDPSFPNAITSWNATPLTLRERRMMSLMGELTDKPDWARKVLDEEIVSKWRTETMAANDDAKPELILTDKAFDYCIQEMRDYASKLEQTEMVPAINGDGAVYKSDTRISAELKSALRTAAAPLEEVDDDKKDWHPNSDNKVLDLVHPSLFPLLYGRSTALSAGSTVSLTDCDSYIGKGTVVPVPQDDDLIVKGLDSMWRWRGAPQHFYSKKYQWLPCEVAFKGDDQVEITSYINNLRPQDHQPLYRILEKIINKVVPMWNACLTDYQFPPRDDADGEWIEPEERPRGKDEEEQLDEDEIYDLDEEWRTSKRVLVMPELESDYQTRAKYGEDDSTVNLRNEFASQGLQIIVKLANIHLDPEKPNYEGGSWHIEGQLNEHICASALYYYDSSNIEDSYLSFRETTDVEHLSEKPYDQGDHLHIERVYGVEQEGPAVQVLGRVNTREGRLLAFPNVFQHRVEPFSLTDKSKAGHRKILALFLVDPYTRIPSTAHVPPQQKHWWRKMLYGLDRVADLPPELAEGIVDGAGTDLPFDMEEAKAIRLELMEERKIFIEEVDAKFEELEKFSFCEH